MADGGLQLRLGGRHLGGAQGRQLRILGGLVGGVLGGVGLQRLDLGSAGNARSLPLLPSAFSKKDFLNDVYGTLAAVPRKLARGARKLGDILVARLLRNGKVTKDYTKTNFFATGKPLSPSGARSGTFNNLTGMDESHIARIGREE